MASSRQMVRSSMVVGFFALVGGLTGIVVDTSIAAKLGLSRSSDAFYVAFTVPYIISNLVTATGQFSLVPFFTWLETRHSEEELWKGFSYAANLVALGLAGLAVAGAALAPWIIPAIAPGFTSPQTEFSIQLTRWLFLIIVPAGVAEVFRSFLLSRHHFALPSAAGFIRNVVIILFILLGYSRYGPYSIVAGYFVGYLVQLLALASETLARFHVRYRCSLSAEGEAFQKLRSAGTAQLASAAAWQGVVIVERIIASFLPVGTLTALNYGSKIVTTLVELLGGSVGTATLPALSRAVARAEQVEERRTFRTTLEITLVLLTPTLVFCVLLHSSIIRLVFERGRFTPEATVLMAMVFTYYSFSLFPYSFFRLLTFYLFARNQPGVFLRLSVLTYSLTVAFDLIYVGILRMGAKGIPMGMLTGFFLASVLAIQRNVAGLRAVLDRSLIIFVGKNLLGGLLAALVVWVLRQWVRTPISTAQTFAYLCELCGVGSLIYFATVVGFKALPIRRLADIWPAQGDS